MLAKPATVATPIHELLAARWSPRAFDAQRVVTRSQVMALVEAARWAPSCFGEEPWRFIVWDRTHDAASWQKAFACLGEGNQSWVKNTSLLMVAAAEPKFSESGQDDRWYQYDAGAASMSLCLQAVALGLAAHQMGGFNVHQLRKTFEIPENIALMAMIAVGYQAEIEVLAPAAQEREAAPRNREPLATRFFEGSWGKAIA